MDGVLSNDFEGKDHTLPEWLTCLRVLQQAEVSQGDIARDVGPVIHLSQESPVFGAFLIAMLMKIYDVLNEQGKKVFKATIVPFVIAIVVIMAFLIRTSTGGRILAIIDPFPYPNTLVKETV